MNPSALPAGHPLSAEDAGARGTSREAASSSEGPSDTSPSGPTDQDGGVAGKAGAGAAPSDEKLLTTGEMARLSNSTLRTVRFYEEEGILRPAKRTDGGHRLFRKTELDRLLFVTDLRTAGLSLDEIKEILDLKKVSQSGEQAARSAMRIFGARIQELQEKVAVLTRLRDDFTRTSDIVSACLTCNDNEYFPNACGVCSVMASHNALPRSTRVVWAVGTMPSKPHSIAEVDGEGDGTASSAGEAGGGHDEGET